jgi:nucleotide-binding universal stress UspA family protein
MASILVSVDTNVSRAKKQVESITTLPLDPTETEIVLYHVFRVDDEGADAADLKSVSSAADHLENAGFDVQISQSSGDTVRNVLNKAEEIDADIISLAGRRRSPAGKALFGSVTQDVALKSDRTLLIEMGET